jgi:hypothetical protein
MDRIRRLKESGSRPGARAGEVIPDHTVAVILNFQTQELVINSQCYSPDAEYSLELEGKALPPGQVVRKTEFETPRAVLDADKKFEEEQKKKATKENIASTSNAEPIRSSSRVVTKKTETLYEETARKQQEARQRREEAAKAKREEVARAKLIAQQKREHEKREEEAKKAELKRQEQERSKKAMAAHKELLRREELESQTKKQSREDNQKKVAADTLARKHAEEMQKVRTEKEAEIKAAKADADRLRQQLNEAVRAPVVGGPRPQSQALTVAEPKFTQEQVEAAITSALALYEQKKHQPQQQPQPTPRAGGLLGGQARANRASRAQEVYAQEHIPGDEDREEAERNKKARTDEEYQHQPSGNSDVHEELARLTRRLSDLQEVLSGDRSGHAVASGSSGFHNDEATYHAAAAATSANNSRFQPTPSMARHSSHHALPTDLVLPLPTSSPSLSLSASAGTISITLSSALSSPSSTARTSPCSAASSRARSASRLLSSSTRRSCSSFLLPEVDSPRKRRTVCI